MTSLHTETLFDETETVNSKQISVLKKHFPQCFDKHGHFQPEKMMEVVKANEVEIVKESYSLNWLGKSYARLLTNLPPQGLLKPDTEHNSAPENSESENLLIKGDNLEVLKHLVNGYREQIKMIYIDPPYNTGSDGFVYQDSFNFSLDDLSRLAGIDKAEAERILSFTTKGSNSHSAWLTFMYPRLYIARELLKEDGVIFISIDDNEQSQLKLICDEVFGEENLLSQFTWRTDGNFDNQAKIKINHEYILCYTKSPGLFGFPEVLDPNVDESSKLFNDEIINTIVKNGPKNPISKVVLPVGFRASFSEGVIKARSDSYPFFHNDAFVKNGELTNEVVVESGWSSKRNLELFIGNNLKPTLDTKGQLTDYRLTENGAIESVKVRNIQSHVVSVLMNMGNTQSMGAQLSKEFDIPFSFPKPISLIKYLISIATNQDSLVLDFFAGSGTTHHALMELNSFDNGGRKCISIQLPEKTLKDSLAYQKGYKTIFEITQDRLEKSANSVINKNPNFKGDLGFKIYETTNDFRPNIDDDFEVANESLFDDMVLSDEQYQALLTTWMLYDNNHLTQQIEDIDLEGYKAHLVDKGLYLINSDFRTKNLKQLLDKLDTDRSFAPNRIIVNGYNFDTAMQMELNEAIKSYQNKKSISINIIVRY